MQTFSDANKVQVGDIAGVITWPAKSFEDSRGVFFKPFSVLDLEEFKVSFETVEHFFTVSKKNVFRGMHFQDSPHSAAKIISIDPDDHRVALSIKAMKEKNVKEGEESKEKEKNTKDVEEPKEEESEKKD